MHICRQKGTPSSHCSLLTSSAPLCPLLGRFVFGIIVVVVVVVSLGCLFALGSGSFLLLWRLDILVLLDVEFIVFHRLGLVLANILLDGLLQIGDFLGQLLRGHDIAGLHEG